MSPCTEALLHGDLVRRHARSSAFLAVWALVSWLSQSAAQAQGFEAPYVPDLSRSRGEETAPARVDVRSTLEDADIAERLQSILTATDWFDDVRATSEQGVVFLRGVAESEPRKRWASELARNTEGVVAVVNHMSMREAPLWDFGPALQSIRNLVRSVVLGLPGAGFALLVLTATWVVARLTRTVIERASRRRVQNSLLRRVIARGSALMVLLLGVYIVLYVSGLTRLAVSVLGGTGLIGLALGIAFRDISENFLASIFLSIQQPFRVDDLVEVSGITGYVQRTTYRVTVLVTLDGHQLQIPNATVYKAVIRNFTSNRSRRESFSIGVGFDVPISRAQEIAHDVLNDHPAVLAEPEPWVLVDSLGSATVNLRIYFWIDGTEHSWLKVKSSVMRLVKRAFQDANISMPDEAREVVFPDGVLIRMANNETEKRDESGGSREESREVVGVGEAQLRSDAADLKEQSSRGRQEHAGENLLTNHEPI